MSMLQELFNKSVAGLASQGFERSVVRVGEFSESCAYRGTGGRRCAIGWLIPEEAYTPKLESMVVYELPEETIRAITGDPYFHIPDETLIMQALDDLQSAHDLGDTPEEMRDKLRKLAMQYGLQLPPELQNA